MLNKERAAIIWCTDGGDYDYWRYSLASMRMQVKMPADFYVITLPTDNLHNLDRIFGLTRIDPTPYMEELGFTKDGYDALGKRWPVAILYKLCVPLIGVLKEYSSVVTLDTDVMAMPTPKLHTVDDVLRHPLCEFEVGGVPDLYEPLDRAATVIQNTKMIPEYIRDELDERVWSKHGRGCQAYISAGLFLWNIPVIDRDIDWYIRRCKAFWSCISAYRFPEQDFVNGFMATDSRLQTAFGARASGNGPYIVADACMRHFTGVGKHLMHKMAKNIPEITPAARFDQACLRPRDNPIQLPPPDKIKRCVVWSSSSKEEDVTKLEFAINSFMDTCGEDLKDIDLYVLTDGPQLAKLVTRDDVKILDISKLYDISGFRAVCNWRSGWISWDRNRIARLFIPFVPELEKYDIALFIEGDMLVANKRMLNIFKEDITGYDYGMVAEFNVHNGVYDPHPSVRFCKAFLQAQWGVADANTILGRLNSGVYYSASVFLANMAELRRTYKDMLGMCRLGVACIGNGAPAVEKDLPNSTCLIKRIPGAYNTAGSTHILGEPTYCVHNYLTESNGARYPKPRIGYY